MTSERMASGVHKVQDVTEDASLVRRCLKGHADAIRELIERFQAEVFSLCVRLLTHRQDAEDVTQETFLRVLRSLHRWDTERPLRPWVLGIAVNRCRTWMGRRVNRPELADYLHETSPRDVPDDSVELVVAIRQALRGMRPDYQSVFTLFHEQGRSYEEIAAVHGRPVGTIKTWLHRARLEILTHLRLRGTVLTDESVEEPTQSPAALR
jgi:RNA polymerase sigma-70 factor (ECF subfamily)